MHRVNLAPVQRLVLYRTDQKITMIRLLSVIVLATVVELIVGKGSIDHACTLKSNGQPGICKLIKNCGSALKNLDHLRYPQTLCGIEEEGFIICCPIENKLPQRKPGEVSRTKCREYSDFVYEIVPQPILLRDAPPVRKYECGHKVVKLIIGGEEAGRKEFPHMAAIGFEQDSGEVEWSCGGTIVSDKFILTAAHCLRSKRGNAKWVLLGVTDLNDNSRHKQKIKVAERIIHPEYEYLKHQHDIGLLRLEKPAHLSSFARPACLYVGQQIDAQKAIATGWGYISSNASSSSNLLKVTIDLFDHNSCNSLYKNSINRKIIDETEFCAGSLLGEEKNTCQGDSGGPLQIYHGGDDLKCMYDVVGVTSFGKDCSSISGVYVRVSHYIKWIEDIVWPPEPLT